MNILPIILTCDDNYYKYANVVITSILCNINKKTQYDINILSEYISEKNQNLTQKQIQRYKNVTVKFIKLKNFDKSKFFLNSYMNATTYYRFYIPEIFNKYNRIIYLDCDIIVDTDISVLQEIDFNEKLALCCLSPYIINKIKLNNDLEYPLDYFTNTLKMKKPLEYFNAGMMVYNLEKIRFEKVDEKLFNSLKEIKEPKLQDQDLLNYVFNNNGGVKIIDQKYNNTRKYKITTLRLLYNGFLKKIGFKISTKNKLFYIYHYVGKQKPWNNEMIDSKLFYYYACKSPFIQEIAAVNQKKLNFFEKYVFTKI